MVTIKMLTSHAWTYRLPGAARGALFESCGEAMLSLMELGYGRADIRIDFESETRRMKTPARKVAARYVETFGRDGRDFTPWSVMPGSRK